MKLALIKKLLDKADEDDLQKDILAYVHVGNELLITDSIRLDTDGARLIVAVSGDKYEQNKRNMDMEFHFKKIQ